MCTERVEEVAGTNHLIEAAIWTEFSSPHDVPNYMEQKEKHHENQSGRFLSIEAPFRHRVVGT